MADLYGKEEKIEEEKVDKASSQTGSYLAVVGRTYKFVGKKRNSINTDFFLVNRTSVDGNMNFPIMKLHQVEGKYRLEFLQSKDGKNKTFGATFIHRNTDAVSSDGENLKAMFGGNRRKFARVFGAYDETNETIGWKKIQACAGKLVSLDLVEKNDYLNIDLKTMQLYDHPPVDPSNLKELYDILEIEKMQREGEKLRTGPQEAAPPPDDEHSPSPSSQKKKNDNDLPF